MVFTVEAAVRIIVQGFWVGKRTYLRRREDATKEMMPTLSDLPTCHLFGSAPGQRDGQPCLIYQHVISLTPSLRRREDATKEMVNPV